MPHDETLTDNMVEGYSSDLQTQQKLFHAVPLGGTAKAITRVTPTQMTKGPGNKFMLDGKQEVNMDIAELLDYLTFNPKKMNCQILCFEAFVNNTADRNDVVQLKTTSGYSAHVECVIVDKNNKRDSTSYCEPITPDVKNNNPTNIITHPNDIAEWHIDRNHPLHFEFALWQLFQFTDEYTVDAAKDVFLAIQNFSPDETRHLSSYTDPTAICALLARELPRDFDDITNDRFYLNQSSMAYYIAKEAIRHIGADVEKMLQSDTTTVGGGSIHIKKKNWEQLFDNPMFGILLDSHSLMLATAFCSMRDRKLKLTFYGFQPTEVLEHSCLQYVVKKVDVPEEPEGEGTDMR